ncbi:hypothetical protein B0O99DRAFT_683441 [Bisporella sp. PMI_857]|nr:hypothetical protein B0O99DRAFT_683441 [Bisporella sp. PMI_857]
MVSQLPVRVSNPSRRSSIAFVHLSHPDDLRSRNIQAGIRSHVMRDIGRSRQKRSRLVTIPLEVVSQPLESGEHHMYGRTGPDGLLITRPPEALWPRLLLPLNQLGIFGVDLDDRALQIIHLIKLDIEYRYQAFHAIWIRIALSDPSALYLCLATSLLSWDRRNNSSVGDFGKNTEAANYYTKALRQLSRRLSDPSECTSAGVIATIVGFLCHDAHIGEWKRWAVHLDGLDRILTLRGSVDVLEKHVALIAFWLDIIGSSALDSPPRFPIPKELTAPSTSSEEMPPALRTVLLHMRLVFPRLSTICQTLCMMSSVAQIVNYNCNNLHFWQDAVGAVSLLGPVTHHLLSLSRVSDVSSEHSGTLVMGELIRLTCLMLLSRLKSLFSLNVLDTMPLCTKFMVVVAQSMEEDVPNPLMDIKIWALISSALLQPEDNTKALIRHIRTAARSRGIASGRNAIELVQGLIWISTLMGRREAQLADDIGVVYS